MKIDKCRQRCPDCGRRTDHVVRVGRLQGRGRDAYHDVAYQCQACGRVQTTKRYPNLLAGFFSVPAAGALP